MEYKFISDLTMLQYEEIIKEINYNHFKNDFKWNKYQNDKNIKYVALKRKRTYLTCAKIIIKNKIFYITNITILKDEKETLKLFLKYIKLLAKSLKIYQINILDINNCSKQLGKIVNKEKYSLIDITNKEKVLKNFSINENKLLSFNTKTTNNEIKKLNNIINNWNINLGYNINKLIKYYKNSCIIKLVYIDLVYYLELYQNNSKLNYETILELIDEYGEEMVVGFSITLLPTNKNSAYCIALHTIDSFNELNIKDNLILNTILTINKKKYSNIFFNQYIKSAKTMYEYNYKIVTNKFKNFINKLKKEDN